MLLFMAAACVAAKIKGFRLRLLFCDTAIYPLLAVECVYWVFQGMIFRGNYSLISYSRWLQAAYLLSLLFPILRHRLYGQAVAGCAMALGGTALNRLAMAQNGGQMPVYPTLSRLTGYFTEESLSASGDAAHCLMHEGTRLKFLCDYIDVGVSIMSPGDILIHGFVAVVLYAAIAALNRTMCGGEEK